MQFKVFSVRFAFATLVFASLHARVCANAACWTGSFTYELCCDKRRGPQGFQACWTGPPFTYSFCCEATEDLPAEALSPGSCLGLPSAIGPTSGEWAAVLLGTSASHSGETRDTWTSRLGLLHRILESNSLHEAFADCPDGATKLLFDAFRASYWLQGVESARGILHGIHTAVWNGVLPAQLPLAALVDVLQGFIGDWPVETSAGKAPVLARRDQMASAVLDAGEGEPDAELSWWAHLPGGAPVARSANELMLGSLFESTLDSFRATVLEGQGGLGPLAPPNDTASIRLSEAFVVAAFCRLFGVGAILESGVHHGFSTEIWARWLGSDAGHVRVVAADTSLHPAALQRLGQFPSIALEEGDGRSLLPDALQRLAADNSSRAVAAVVDGPKRERALELACRLLSDQSRLVRFAAIHDARHWKHGPRRAAWRRYGLRPLFFSDEPWFLRRFAAVLEQSAGSSSCAAARPRSAALACAARQTWRKAFSPPGGAGVMAVVELRPMRKRKEGRPSCMLPKRL